MRSAQKYPVKADFNQWSEPGRLAPGNRRKIQQEARSSTKGLILKLYQTFWKNKSQTTKTLKKLCAGFKSLNYNMT